MLYSDSTALFTFLINRFSNQPYSVFYMQKLSFITFCSCCTCVVLFAMCLYVEMYSLTLPVLSDVVLTVV